WDRDRSDPRHVIDDLRLREPARVERLVEVAETDAPTVDVDVDLVGHRSTYADFLARRFFDGAGSAATSSPFDEGCRPRACFAAFTLASSAAIKSTTLGFSTASSGRVNSSPAALIWMRSSTCSRYSSRYFSGSNAELSESTRDSAIATSF